MGYIYKITNIVNNKIYIGQTTRNVEIRFKEHLRAKDDYPIHKAIRKYGKDNFKVEIIEECANENLNEKEKYYIKIYNSYNGHIGYNASPGGNSAAQVVQWIKTHPQEVKENLNKVRPLAIQKFKDNPELQIKREQQRQKGYQKYIENNREKWLEAQQKKLKKAREKLKEEYNKDPSKIIKRAQENGKKASRPVRQIDLETGIAIQDFESCSAAARALGKEGGHSNISKACRKNSTAYGYRWVYI